MDYDQVTDRVFAGMMQGFVVAFVGLAAFLPASYVMNRFIYRSWTMRTFMGILAAFAGLGGLVIMFILRAYWGDSMLIHYFGLLPIRTKGEETASTERSWFMSIFIWLLSPFLPPITFYYDSAADKEGYANSIKTLLENFNTGEQKERGDLPKATDSVPVREQTVYEPLFTFARTFGHVWSDTPKSDTWSEYMSSKTLPPNDKYNYAGLSLRQASEISKKLLA